MDAYEMEIQRAEDKRRQGIAQVCNRLADLSVEAQEIEAEYNKETERIDRCYGKHN